MALINTFANYGSNGNIPIAWPSEVKCPVSESIAPSITSVSNAHKIVSGDGASIKSNLTMLSTPNNFKFSKSPESSHLKISGTENGLSSFL